MWIRSCLLTINVETIPDRQPKIMLSGSRVMGFVVGKAMKKVST